MKDVNWNLRKAYTTALAAVSIPSFYQSAPPSFTDDYIVFRSINSNNASTKNTSDTSTSITVEIHTFENGSNNGRKADDVAGEVFAAIYPYTQYVLPLDNMQMVSTVMVSDVTNTVQVQNNRTYINRFITFRHIIFAHDDIS